MSWQRYSDWKKRFGMPNMHNGNIPRSFWLQSWEVQAILDYKREHPDIGYRCLTYKMLDEDVVAVSPATTYRYLSLNGLTNRWNTKSTGSKKKKGFDQPTKAHEHWHVDISYISFQGTFLFLISVLDGFSRYVVHHELRMHMQEFDVEIVIQRALEKRPGHNTRIISDNGSQFLSGDFKTFLKDANLTHVRTSVNYPQSNGKIEAYHKTVKNECIRRTSLLSLEDARKQVSRYIEIYNNERLHSGIGYIAPLDKLNGRAEEIFKERDRKLEIARKCRRENAQQMRVFDQIAMNYN